MGLKDMLKTEDTRRLLIEAPAARFVHGALRTEEDGQGLVRPWRMSESCMRVLGSCMAWHPGLYKQMGRTSAGIVLKVRTNSLEIGLELVWDEEPSGTRAVLKDVDGRDPAAWKAHDGVSCTCDGRELAFHEAGERAELVTWYLDEDTLHPSWHLQRLPGFGPEHEVEIWLPCLRGVRLGKLWGDGTTLAPVEVRPLCLLLGDSISQGFVAEDPCHAWAAQWARSHDLDLLNLSVGGQVFEPQFFEALPRGLDVAQIVVELGANYRYEAYPESRLRFDVRTSLAALAARYPDAETIVLTPLPYREERYETHPRSCIGAVAPVLADECARYPYMQLIDGSHLSDRSPRAFADGCDHPGEAGQATICRRLELLLHPDGRTQEEQAQAAEEILAHAPRQAFPLAEQMRRGGVSFLSVSEGAILAREADGTEILYAPDAEAGKDALALWSHASRLLLLSPELAPFAAEELGLTKKQPLHLAVYKGRRRCKIKKRYRIETLGEEAKESLCDFLHGRSDAEDKAVLASLADATLLGGFDGDELVGVVGLRADGSIGPLEVKPEWRRRGWASALEGRLVNHLLAEDRVPWALIAPESKPSLRLHSELGFEVSPADEQCLLVRGNV
ncbi:MAG: GNAT family N-acetyltransferase [Atopobiaceae bacterium]